MFLSPWIGAPAVAVGDEPKAAVVSKPDLFSPLTEPPCSYCSTQHLKGFIRLDDPVLAWLRATHNGGAFPLRYFLAGPRVLNDTYGLFLLDTDGGYVSAYEKDYGYKFHGWRRGVMVVEGRDGTLWSALSGRAFEGPKKGQALRRIPSLTTSWGYWLMLHPESTSYDLFDGKKYADAPLPASLSQEARDTMGEADSRLDTLAPVLGVTFGVGAKAFPLAGGGARSVWLDTVGSEPVAVLWYGATRTAIAFSRRLEGRELTLYADEISPESAPFKDKETGTRWSVAGRGIDGELRGKELRWVDSVQCRWYAWAAEYPRTEVHEPRK